MFFKIYNFSSSFLLLLSIMYYNLYESEAIVNGKKAQPGEFPSIVSLRNETGRHYCGGTLVTRKHVVTAAHCVFEDNSIYDFQASPVMLKPENMKVVAGTLSRVKGGETYKVEKFTVHPQYDVNAELYFNNDVAVLTLKQKVNKENIIPTPISTTIPQGGASGKIAGWGLLHINENEDFIHQNNLPTDLQKLPMVVLDKETCKKKFSDGSRSVRQIDTGYIICVKSNYNNTGVCARDSGSPFLINGKFAGYVLGGIPPCGTGKPDFIAPTAIYKDFINGVINA